MSIIENMMESESFKRNYGQNKELYDSIDVASDHLRKSLNSFVIANINEFIEPTLQGTIKNIKVFSEFATQQGLIEMKSYVDNMVYKEDAVLESATISEYI